MMRIFISQVVSESRDIPSRNLKFFQEYFGFIKAMNIAVRGKSLVHECQISPVTKGILNIIDALNKILDETPAIDQPQRFGNKAFRSWYEKLKTVRNLSSHSIAWACMCS